MINRFLLSLIKGDFTYAQAPVPPIPYFPKGHQQPTPPSKHTKRPKHKPTYRQPSMEQILSFYKPRMSVIRGSRYLRATNAKQLIFSEKKVNWNNKTYAMQRLVAFNLMSCWEGKLQKPHLCFNSINSALCLGDSGGESQTNLNNYSCFKLHAPAKAHSDSKR